MKISPVGAELFYVDRQTANSRFSHFCERTYKSVPQLKTETPSSQLSLKIVLSFFDSC